MADSRSLAGGDAGSFDQRGLRRVVSPVVVCHRDKAAWTMELKGWVSHGIEDAET